MVACTSSCRETFPMQTLHWKKRRLRQHWQEMRKTENAAHLLRHWNSNWLSSEFKDTELPLCAAAKNEKIWSCRFLGSGMLVFWCIAAVICPESATSGLKTFSTHGRTRLWVPSVGANVARNTFSSWKYCSSATNDHCTWRDKMWWTEKNERATI